MESDELGNEVIDADDFEIRLPRVRRPLSNYSGSARVLQNGSDTRSKFCLDFLPMKSDRGRGRPARMPRPSDFLFVPLNETLPFPVSPPNPPVPSSVPNCDARPIRKGRGMSMGSKSMSSTGSPGSSVKSDSGLTGIERLDHKELPVQDQFRDAEEARTNDFEPMGSQTPPGFMANSRTGITTASEPSKNIVKDSDFSNLLKSTLVKAGVTATKTDHPNENLPEASEHLQTQSFEDFSKNFQLVSTAVDQRAAEYASAHLKSAKYSPLITRNALILNSEGLISADPSLFVGTMTTTTESPQFVVVKSPCRISSRGIGGARSAMCMADFSKKVPSPCSNLVSEAAVANLKALVPEKIPLSSNTDFQSSVRHNQNKPEHTSFGVLPLRPADLLQGNAIKSKIEAHNGGNIAESHHTTTFQCDSQNVPSNTETAVVKSGPSSDRLEFKYLQRPTETEVTVTQARSNLQCEAVSSKPKTGDTKSMQPVQLIPAETAKKSIPFAADDDCTETMKEPSPLRNLEADLERSCGATTMTTTTISAQACKSQLKVMPKKLTLKNLTSNSAAGSVAQLSQNSEDSKSSSVQPKSWDTWRDKPIPFEQSNLGSTNRTEKEAATKDPKSGVQAKPSKHVLRIFNSGDIDQEALLSKSGHSGKLLKNEPPTLAVIVDKEASRVSTLATTSTMLTATTVQASKSPLKVMPAKLTLKKMTPTAGAAQPAHETEECKSSHAQPKTWEEAQMLNPPRFDQYGLPIRQPVQRFCMAHDFPSLPSGNPNVIVEASSISPPLRVETVDKKPKRSRNRQKAKACNQQPVVDCKATEKDVHLNQPQEQQQQTNYSTIVIENLPMDTNRGFILDFLQQFDRNVDVKVSNTATGKTAEARLTDDETCDWIVSILNNMSFSGNSSDIMKVWKRE